MEEATSVFDPALGVREADGEGFFIVASTEIEMKQFDIGQEVLAVEPESRGNKWLFYWLLGENESFCYITDGSAYVEVTNPHEWQDDYVDALAITRDEAMACDLTCEKIKRLLQARGEWTELM